MLVSGNVKAMWMNLYQVNQGLSCSNWMLNCKVEAMMGQVGSLQRANMSRP